MKAIATGAFAARFGTPPVLQVRAPGRVNLIGEHVDYAGLPVLPMAIDRGIRLAVRPRDDGRVRIVDEREVFGRREFELDSAIPPYAPGDWGNYPKAALQGLVAGGFEPVGFDALLTSDLPPAAGLSSSSALVVATALAGLAAARHPPADRLALAGLLAEAERYVGARGGGMDQAAILAGEAGHALRIDFEPLAVHPVTVPADWRFVVAHSLASAEKSGAARDTYNERRATVEAAGLAVGGGSTYAALVAGRSVDELVGEARSILDDTACRRFRHVVTEADRVERAVVAMAAADAGAFGDLMLASHASLRDDFAVSTAALDELVDAAIEAGAVGARLTGAGLGGCVVALLRAPEVPAFTRRLAESFYASRGPEGLPDVVFPVRPSRGASVRSL